MKIVKIQCRTLIALAVMILLWALTPSHGWADTPPKVLILPLDLYSDQDLGFLQKGIQEMLITRLTVPGKIQPLAKDVARQAREAFADPLNEGLLAEMGRQFQADYILHGSLTVFGKNISTDARFYNVQENQTAVTFSKTGASPGDVIEHVNLFAAQVNDEVFGRRQTEYQPPAPPSGESQSRMHPDKLWLEESAKMDQAVVATGGDGGRVPFTIWRSRNFSEELVGLSVGDVDRDGQNEIVMAGKRRIWVYRFLNQQFTQIAEFQGASNDVYLGVDLADINANGKEELFVTSRSDLDQRLNSFVLEWDGHQLGQIAGPENWFYRVVRDPIVGKVLLGQRRGSRTAFANQIYEINWNGQAYGPGERRKVPGTIPSVFGIGYGDVLNNQETTLVGMDKKNQLQVYNASGQNAWSGFDRMVGGTTYVEIPQGAFNSPSQRSGEDIRRPREFLPQRVHVADLDRDGRHEVYLANNDDSTGRALPHSRVLRSGHVACLTWDQIGLIPLWKTRDMPGYVADTAIADFDNDGELDLVYAVVVGKKMFSGKARSSLYAWKPNLSEVQPKAAE